MAKEESLRMTGVVMEALPNAMFKVKITDSHSIIATLGGKIRQNNIQVLLGDNVDIEISPYNLTKGRIVYRR